MIISKIFSLIIYITTIYIMVRIFKGVIKLIVIALLIMFLLSLVRGTNIHRDGSYIINSTSSYIESIK